MNAKEQQTLERLLQDDPIQKLFDAYSAAVEPYMGKMRTFSDVMDALKRGRSDPELSKTLQALDEHNGDDVRKAAELLGVDVTQLSAYLVFAKQAEKEILQAVNLPRLKRSWKALLRLSPIEEIKKGPLPGDEAKPYIVFYSAGWCLPCHVRKPTFARLARFFDKARLFYCANEELRTQEGVVAIPALIAYFPGGSRVHGSTGNTTKGLWEALNLLITLGRDYQGDGQLMCTDEECRIEPWKYPTA